ncbi:FMN-binding negative transcriptional regulator [Aliiroseovarius crassostreae]|uniref:FMN-binding negative transcriptional regulator n=1 Tax=Aliiroseovarius crassostreae TaxID=154981 RepID=UPI00220A8BA7|nr:FMN-binding negative transcriptional regulator [Aliiroseovarius crassostreae]UWQ07949.1 FMN-binding negative transcriptional regulator [Aliiroseovarius crassostreae]UWQ11055.1 FMN-binding negative transcriptional regulator [Aliiroseovarius crassostreae]
MHPNPAFRQVEDLISLDFARKRGFGVLGVNGSVGPVMVHLPFILSDDGRYAEFHLMRSNEVARLLDQPIPATLSVNGPDGYISPDWYGVDDQVPTWNYVAVHLRGHVEAMPEEGLEDLLHRQVAAFEERIEGKSAWSMEKMATEARARMMRQIRPARLQVERLESTFKLGQNKGDAARLAAADQLETGLGQDVQSLADLMRNLPG